MKYLTKLFIISAAAIASFAGCTEKPQPDEEKPGTEKPGDEKPGDEKPGDDTAETIDLTLTATAPEGCTWYASDCIGVYTTAGMQDFAITEGAGTAEGVFTAKVEKGTEILDIAVFPSDKFFYDGTQLTFNMPSEFTRTDALYFTPMVAKKDAGNGKMVFHSLTGTVKADFVAVPSSNEACVFTASKRITGDLTVDLSSEVPSLVIEESEGEHISVLAGAGESGAVSFIIPVPAADYSGYSINLGSSDREWIMETSVRTYDGGQIEAGSETTCPEVRIYKIKQYGDKIWFVEACKESGPDGTLGRTIDFTKLTEAQLPDVTFEKCGMKTKQEDMGRDAQFLAKKVWTSDFGTYALEYLQEEGVRYYTWFEAMTGKPDASGEDIDKLLSSGIDAAGHPFAFDSGESEFNAQIQGCCPDGYHVSNLNDWWDLLHSIKNEYNVPDNVTSPEGYYWPGDQNTGYDTTIGDGEDMRSNLVAGAGFSFGNREFKYKSNGEVVTVNGTTPTVTKQEMLNKGTNLYTLGNVTPWLIGPHSAVALYKGGLWNHLDCNWGKVDQESKNARYSMYIKNGGGTGFNWYQFGSFTSKKEWDTSKSARMGDWVGVWLPGTVETADGKTRARGFCIRREAGANTSLRHFQLSELFTTWDQSSRIASIPVRCVKNYQKTSSDF